MRIVFPMLVCISALLSGCDTSQPSGDAEQTQTLKAGDSEIAMAERPADEPPAPKPDEPAPPKRETLSPAPGDSLETLKQKLADAEEFDMALHNQLRHEYAIAGNQEQAMEHVEMILKHVPLDGYMNQVLGGKNDDAAAAIAELKQLAAQYSQHPNTVSACWIWAADRESDSTKAAEYLRNAASVQGASEAYYQAVTVRQN